MIYSVHSLSAYALKAGASKTKAGTLKTFEQAAFAVLREHGGALSYKEIARRAMDAGILDAEGSTPESTMGARLHTNAGAKGSPFEHAGGGTFRLRPGATASMAGGGGGRRVLRLGESGEYRLISELVRRGYMIIPGDIDSPAHVTAAKGDKIFNILVYMMRKSGRGGWKEAFRDAMFDIDRPDDLYDVFVIYGTAGADFVIMPPDEAGEYVSTEWTDDSDGYETVSIRSVDGRYTMNGHDVTKYLNNWEILS